MNRRNFLSALAGLAATATLDPEKLLWVPGRKLISIPAPLPPVVVPGPAVDVIIQALRMVGAVPPIFTPQGVGEALEECNRMLDRWNVDRRVLHHYHPARRHSLALRLADRLAMLYGYSENWRSA